MLMGRNVQLQMLENMANSDKSTFTIMYGRTGIGKMTLLKHFIAGKRALCYCSPQASAKEQFVIMREQFAKQLEALYGSDIGKSVMEAEHYAALFALVQNDTIIVIEEFQNIVKSDSRFIEAAAELVRGGLSASKVMLVCSSSSVSWIENSLVSLIGANAYAITTFLKLKELSFVDAVRMFPKFSVEDCVRMYAVTGGVPLYMAYFTDKISIKENICRLILEDNAPLRSEGADFIKEELRETSLYNTILYCIAQGEYKLNELHAHTGFGRDKISVYLKNLIEREIVEKVFSFDASAGGSEHTRKGLYNIRSSMTAFWFRFIYARETEMMLMTASDFYDKYIADALDDFAAGTFVKVGTEYIELLGEMNQLPLNIEKRGRWWGKTGNIDIIACDSDGKYIIGSCNWVLEKFTFAMFEELVYNASLAGVGSDYIYLFSRGEFDEKLVEFAKNNPNIVLVGIDEL